MSSSKHEIYKSLVKFYFQGYLHFNLKTDDIAEMTWNKQKLLLEATIHNPLIKQYPINTDFSRLFFKKLISFLEPTQEVHDEMYGQLCDLMNNNSDQDCFHYRHYVIGNDLNEIVTIKETNNMVINGTTGMRTWQAGLMIADWALCNKGLFSNKKVLELGSGVGFTGITIAKLCKTREFIFTDCHNDVLRAIRDNISINIPDVQQEEKLDTIFFQNKELCLGVLPLNWDAIKDFPNNIIPDIVIGADVIYDPVIIDALCNVIKTFIQRNRNVEVYIASVIRNQETFKHFLSALDLMGFNYEEISQPRNIFIFWQSDVQRCLLKIN